MTFDTTNLTLKVEGGSATAIHNYVSGHKARKGKKNYKQTFIQQDYKLHPHDK